MRESETDTTYIYAYLCVEGIVGVVVVAGRAGRGVLTRPLREQLLLQSDIHVKLYKFNLFAVVSLGMVTLVSAWY